MDEAAELVDHRPAVLPAQPLESSQHRLATEAGGLLDILMHPNQAKYPGQRVLVVACNDYVCLVPFVEEEGHFFLKTVIPSRKATRDYLKKGEADAED